MLFEQEMINSLFSNLGYPILVLFYSQNYHFPPLVPDAPTSVSFQPDCPELSFVEVTWQVCSFLLTVSPVLHVEMRLYFCYYAFGISYIVFIFTTHVYIRTPKTQKWVGRSNQVYFTASAKYSLLASQTWPDFACKNFGVRISLVYPAPYCLLDLCFSFTSCNWALQILEDIK